jgi:gliding motility-associated lipoprotein GldH
MIQKFSFLLIAGFTLLFTACDDRRVYEEYQDFNAKNWNIKDTAFFEFQIADTTKKYNLKFNVRNNLDYPYARLFVTYKLSDPAKKTLSTKMISGYLFDQKTGKPFGSSGLGDIYDNQFPLLSNYAFREKGKYRMHIYQYMRLDTVPGILAAGVRVEVAEAPAK